MPNPTGRPPKGLTPQSLRISDEERWMVETVATQLDCTLNDAMRVCIRRGYARVAPSQEIDGPVLDPNWAPAPLTPTSPVRGQQPLFSDSPEDQ